MDTFLHIALNISNNVRSRTNADKVISISPGLFGQIFKMYTDHAVQKRLAYFEQRSCVYAAPTLSAEAAETVIVHKQSDGINTRFAAVNPFDQRVLSALTPERYRSDFSPPVSASPPRTSTIRTPSSPPQRPATVAGFLPSTPPPSGDVLRVNMPTQCGGSKDYLSQVSFNALGLECLG